MKRIDLMYFCLFFRSSCIFTAITAAKQTILLKICYCRALTITKYRFKNGKSVSAGGEILPYEKFYTPEKLSLYYKKYFLHEGMNEWRKGIFRYCIFAHYTFVASKTTAGYAYWPTNENIYDAFVVGIRVIKNYRFTPLARETAIASLFMHELGHTIGLFQHVYKAIDNASCRVPWQEGWKKYENYKSCMNYRYAWSLIEYSDGSHGKGDFNDWATIDSAFFEKIFYADREHRRKKL